MTITSCDGRMSALRKLFFIALIAILSYHHVTLVSTMIVLHKYVYAIFSDHSDVVSCSGSVSSIKRGYWFGKVDSVATSK